ncbi:MAG: DedA family protein [Acidimicrobiales bacterium]|nr:MAG: DedA family protein [Acidimicrobiales bacterium]
MALHGPVAYAIVGALAFGEAAVLLGFVLPGETAVIIGGVLASRGHVSLGVMLVVAVGAAVVGDTVGYQVGRVFGPRLLGSRLLRHRRRGVDAARRFLQRRGGWAVFLGRFTAFFRAMIPGLAGMSEMPYQRFLLANASGGVVWAAGYTLAGYFLGGAYQRVAKLSGRVSTGVVVVVVVALVGLRIRSGVRERRLEREPSQGP